MFALLGLVFAGLLVTGAALAAGSGPSKGCGTIKAGGHVYTVSVQNGVACASGLKWASTLAAQSVHAKTANASLSGGPSGFNCVGNSKFVSSSFPGVGATTQVSGFCRKGTSFTTPYFNWFVKTQ